jgi:hypothetical protein
MPHTMNSKSLAWARKGVYAGIMKYWIKLIIGVGQNGKLFNAFVCSIRTSWFELLNPVQSDDSYNFITARARCSVVYILLESHQRAPACSHTPDNGYTNDDLRDITRSWKARITAILGTNAAQELFKFGVNTSLKHTLKRTLRNTLETPWKHFGNTTKTYVLVNPSNNQTTLPN